jgi:hypothetical protein
LGVLADWLEVLTMLVADRLKAGNWQVERAAIERHVADVATNLEALRGIVYAAAELQHELDRRPMSEHLAAETETLVGEASHFAGRAMHQLRSEAESILVGDCNLLDFFPTRQRPDQQSDWFKEPASYLQRQIAAYYLGLSPIAMPR